MKVKHFQTPIFQKAKMPITETAVRRLPADAQYKHVMSFVLINTIVYILYNY